jgi:MEDS: MEthanogen/methylotroph, DcmR Sensory domain
MMMQAASVFKFKRGDHVCVFYHDDQALLQTLVPYVVEGLRNGERCFCAQRKDFVPVLLGYLASYGVDFSYELKRRALEIHTDEELYLAGHFEPAALMHLLEQSIDEAVAEGFTGFRTAGELSWAANGACDCDQLIAYEKMVDDSFPSKPVVGMCQYHMTAFEPEMLERVLDSHRLSLAETMAGSNHSALQVRYGKYRADIVADRLNPQTTYYYIVQQAGGKDVLSWGSTSSLAAAMTESQQVVDHLQAG